jgi:hypothetical protein
MLKKVTFEGVHERKAQRMADCYYDCKALCKMLCNFSGLAFQEQVMEEEINQV